MAKGDAEGRELPIGAPHAGYPHEEKEGAETKAGGSQKCSDGYLYEGWERGLVVPVPVLVKKEDHHGHIASGSRKQALEYC